jgi:thiol-disulfide isomerase/thioredoxin
MRLTVARTFSARRPPAFVLASVLLAALAGCELDGASKKPEGAKSETPAGARAPRTSRPMPPVETARATSARQGGWTQLDGRRASLEDYRGQVVVLDFYATYCPPCDEEIPHLVRLQRRYGPQGLAVVGLKIGRASCRDRVFQEV